MVLEQRFGYLTTYKIRYIFILFFAWMNYVSGSVIMVLINQIISVITAVFLVFSCLLLPTSFFLLFPIQITHSNCWNDMTFYLAFFSVPISMVTIWDSLSTFLIQWFPAEGLKIGGAQNNRRFLLLFLPKSGGALAPLSPAYPIPQALLNCVKKMSETQWAE